MSRSPDEPTAEPGAEPTAEPTAGLTDRNGLQVRLRQDAPIPLQAELACATGEVLALVGPSGSGKSTILRSIAGLHRPTDGRIRCRGDLWYDAASGTNLPAHRRRVGFVFQSYALFPHMSALGNVTAALGGLASREREARGRALLELVHLKGLEDRLPARLSGGQQQRVAVARALARDPQVLLLDEPFSAVDQVTRHKLQRELADLRLRLDMPAVLVTHDLDEAMLLADRMCILHAGTTLQNGPPAELMARPRNALVARLLGLTNLFEAEVAGHDAERDRTFLRWRGRLLETRHQPGYAPGQPVCFVIPAASVLMHRRDRPSFGERENPVPGVVTEFVPMGAHASVTVRVGDLPQMNLSMTVPVHVARRNGIAPGADVKVSLLAEAIHLMPWEDLRRQTRP